MGGKRLFVLQVLFLCLMHGLFSQSKTIRNLQLNFLREENASNGNSASLTGALLYEAEPFSFVFAVTDPAVQTTYLNSDGCFFLDADGLFDFSENAPFLRQTCNDFITWFKDDYGLHQQGYKIVSCSVEGGQILSVWNYDGDKEVPIEKIKTYSDTNGRIVRIQTFAVGGELLAQTSLQDFASAPGGFSYPAVVVTENYTQGQLLITTRLSFSNVLFNQLSSPSLAGAAVLSPSISSEVPSVSDSQKVGASLEKTFRVSMPSVLVNTGFRLYKKFITNQDMSACPFEPSCSQYMLQSVSKYGIFGAIKGLERLKRCTATEHKRDLYVLTSDNKHLDLLD